MTRAQEKTRLEENLRSLNETFVMQAQRMKDFSDHVDEIRRLRHDMQHHFLSLWAILETGQAADARTYLSDLCKDMPCGNTLPLCRNYVADCIVSRYLAMAENQGMSTKATLSISEEPGVDYSDLGIVLGNLLENAVEGCARQKYGEKFIHIEAKEEIGKLYTTGHCF